MLHMEIIQERLEREFEMTVITTVPNVSYYAYSAKNEKMIIHNPSDYPDPSILSYVEEPYIKAQIITKAEFIGQVMNLCIAKRGELKNQVYLTTDRVEITFEMPLGEIVFDFYDKLKSVSKGYASFDYSPLGMKESKLVRVDLLLNGNSVDALSALVHTDNAYRLGKKICEKLQKLIPGSQFVKGDVKLKDRKDAYDEINEGTNHVVIATYGVAAVGINIPRIFNLVLIEPGKSFVRVIQSIGRGVRKAKDKDFVQIWDLTSTCKFAKRHLTQRKKFYREAQYPFTIEKVEWN